MRGHSTLLAVCRRFLVSPKPRNAEHDELRRHNIRRELEPVDTQSASCYQRWKSWTTTYADGGIIHPGNEEGQKREDELGDVADGAIPSLNLAVRMRRRLITGAYAGLDGGGSGRGVALRLRTQVDGIRTLCGDGAKLNGRCALRLELRDSGSLRHGNDFASTTINDASEGREQTRD
jgi:hypothetical protein